jgi:hypothetical protein
MTAARDLIRYKLDLVGVQEVRWDKGGMVRAGDYIFDVITSLVSLEHGVYGWER